MNNKISETKRLEGWQKAMRKAVSSMKPLGFIEVENDKFLILFDRELDEEEIEKAETLRFEKIGRAYAYSFNPKATMRSVIFAFDAEIIAVWGNLIVYDTEVPHTKVRGLKDLEFKPRCLLDMFEVNFVYDKT